MIASLYDNFKHWSENGSVYLISDPHFNDVDCKLMDANWPTPEEQVNIINSIAHKLDTLVILGDVGDLSYVKQLRAGRKVLIMGNHDEGASKFKKVFDEVYEGALFIGEKILLSHEPIYGLNFCLNIHGHNHAGGASDATHINLASNVCGYTPISLAKIIKGGALSKIETIHRLTIDKASSKK